MAETSVYGNNETKSAGDGTGVFKSSGVIHKDNTETATGANTDETTLHTYNLPANTLSNDGDQIRITAVGIYGAGVDNKTVKLYWGSLTHHSTAVSTNTDGYWLQILVTRRSAGDQLVAGPGVFRNATINRVKDGSEDETGAIEIKVTGTNSVAAANGITGQELMVEYLPA